MSGGELTKIRTQMDGLIDKKSKQILAAVPASIDGERFLSTARTAILQNPDILQCYAPTVLIGVMQAAQLGLPLYGGQAYLLPWNNNAKRRKDAVFVVGYKGMCTLGYRSGMLADIKAVPVRAADLEEPGRFLYQEGSDPKIEHVPNWRMPDEERGPVIGCYSLFVMKDGYTAFQFLARGALEQTRALAPGSKSRSSPWNDGTFHQPGRGLLGMCMKTAVRAGFRTRPVSPEASQVVEAEDSLERGRVVVDAQAARIFEEMGDEVGELPEAEAEGMPEVVNHETGELVPAEEQAAAPPAPVSKGDELRARARRIAGLDAE